MPPTFHTGGTPLFFDYLAHRNPSPKIIKSKDKVKLMSFLLGIDKSLPVALSKRVSFDSYIDKLIEMGEILSIEKDSKIVAAVLFYCNDYRSRNAYISLLGTLPGFEGQGYGTCLIKAAENTSKENGMTSILLDTDKCNLKAIAFYSKCGYQVESAEDKLHLKKDL